MRYIKPLLFLLFLNHAIAGIAQVRVPTVEMPDKQIEQVIEITYEDVFKAIYGKDWYRVRELAHQATVLFPVPKNFPVICYSDEMLKRSTRVVRATPETWAILSKTQSGVLGATYDIPSDTIGFPPVSNIQLETIIQNLQDKKFTDFYVQMLLHEITHSWSMSGIPFGPAGKGPPKLLHYSYQLLNNPRTEYMDHTIFPPVQFRYSDFGLTGFLAGLGGNVGEYFQQHGTELLHYYYNLVLEADTRFAALKRQYYWNTGKLISDPYDVEELLKWARTNKSKLYKDAKEGLMILERARETDLRYKRKDLELYEALKRRLLQMACIQLEQIIC